MIKKISTLKVYVQIALLCIFCLLAVQLPSGIVSAQEVPFECTGQAFTVRFSPAQLFSIDQSVTPFTFTQIGSTASILIDGVLTPIELNNLGFRSTDGMLYAMALKVFVPGASAQNGNYGIVKIDSTGTVFPVAIPAPSPIPGIGNFTYRFAAGDVTDDGSTMYINAQDSSNTTDANRRLYIVDLTRIG